MKILSYLAIAALAFASMTDASLLRSNSLKSSVVPNQISLTQFKSLNKKSATTIGFKLNDSQKTDKFTATQKNEILKANDVTLNLTNEEFNKFSVKDAQELELKDVSQLKEFKDAAEKENLLIKNKITWNKN